MRHGKHTVFSGNLFGNLRNFGTFFLTQGDDSLTVGGASTLTEPPAADPASDQPSDQALPVTDAALNDDPDRDPADNGGGGATITTDTPTSAFDSNTEPANPPANVQSLPGKAFDQDAGAQIGQTVGAVVDSKQGRSGPESPIGEELNPDDKPLPANPAD